MSLSDMDCSEEMNRGNGVWNFPNPLLLFVVFIIKGEAPSAADSYESKFVCI